MTDFWHGFITAIALIAVSIIVAAWISYRRQERKRQAAVDDIMAKVVTPPLTAEECLTIDRARAERADPVEQAFDRRHGYPNPTNPQGKKGIH